MYRELEAAHANEEATNEKLIALNRSLAVALKERDRAESGRRGLEERLLQKQKLESLGVMAGGVAHDFNNILTSIVGHAELLVEQLPPDSAHHAFAEEIEPAGHRAGNLAKQMLAYSGNGYFELEPVDLCEVISKVGELIQASLPPRVRLEYRLDEGLPKVNADASQIQQLVVNLVSNAVQSIGRAGFVSVGVRTATQQGQTKSRSRPPASFLSKTLSLVGGLATPPAMP